MKRDSLMSPERTRKSHPAVKLASSVSPTPFIPRALPLVTSRLSIGCS